MLVDLDLRRPVLHRFFRLEGRVGITDVTLGHAWLDETLVGRVRVLVVRLGPVSLWVEPDIGSDAPR